MDNFNELTPEEDYVINKKGTERPFTNEFDKHNQEGLYVCKKCDAPLYFSEDKFEASCGWPAFDDEFPNAIKKVLDNDGRRTEIVCSNCEGHLGHVFEGERYTFKNMRHCVNSISMKFIPSSEVDLVREFIHTNEKIDTVIYLTENDDVEYIGLLLPRFVPKNKTEFQFHYQLVRNLV